MRFRDTQNMTAPSNTTLYLARHGQSESNDQGLVTGQLDAANAPVQLERQHQRAKAGGARGAAKSVLQIGRAHV